MLILSKTPFYFSMPRFSRRFRRAVYARQKRNVERIIRSGSANMSAGTQSAVFTYTATKACVAKNIKLDIGEGRFVLDNSMSLCFGGGA